MGKKKLSKIDSGDKKFSVTQKQFLKAQEKAFKIWHKLLLKQPNWAFDHSLNENNYVAFAQNPEPHFYVVKHEPTTINTATGMFRFPNEKTANKFIVKMGSAIKYLYPTFEFKNERRQKRRIQPKKRRA